MSRACFLLFESARTSEPLLVAHHHLAVWALRQQRSSLPAKGVCIKHVWCHVCPVSRTQLVARQNDATIPGRTPVRREPRLSSPTHRTKESATRTVQEAQRRCHSLRRSPSKDCGECADHKEGRPHLFCVSLAWSLQLPARGAECRTLCSRLG
jgi:hypothetical protein